MQDCLGPFKDTQSKMISQKSLRDTQRGRCSGILRDTQRGKIAQRSFRDTRRERIASGFFRGTLNERIAGGVFQGHTKQNDCQMFFSKCNKKLNICQE